jgi:hypothetical protein
MLLQNGSYYIKLTYPKPKKWQKKSSWIWASMLAYDKTAMATYPRCVHKIMMPQKTLNQTAKIFSQDVENTLLLS